MPSASCPITSISSAPAPNLPPFAESESCAAGTESHASEPESNASDAPSDPSPGNLVSFPVPNPI